MNSLSEGLSFRQIHDLQRHILLGHRWTSDNSSSFTRCNAVLRKRPKNLVNLNIGAFLIGYMIVRYLILLEVLRYGIFFNVSVSQKGLVGYLPL